MWSKAILVALALVILLGWPGPSHADDAYLPLISLSPRHHATEIGLVVGIVDGDTFDVVLEDGTEDRVRPLCWDAPEISFGVDCYGPEATDHLEELILGQVVFLTRDVSDRGPYDRLLRHVYLEDGTWIGAEMVGDGFARTKEYPPDTRLCPLLWQCQAEAKACGAGGWSVCAGWPDW